MTDNCIDMMVEISKNAQAEVVVYPTDGPAMKTSMPSFSHKNKLFRAFASSTPRTNSDVIDYKKSWEFTFEASDWNNAKMCVLNEARVLGYLDNTDNRFTIETSDLESEWHNFTDKDMNSTRLKPYKDTTGGIYIQEIDDDQENMIIIYRAVVSHADIRNPEHWKSCMYA